MVLLASSSAAEVHSNGKGGGVWSEASTWRGGMVPKAEDDVVIARGDIVAFDRNDNAVAFPETAAAMFGQTCETGLAGALSASAALLTGTRGKSSCQKLSIDPQGTFTLKTGSGKVVLCAAGVLESYGTVKLDARASASDHLELRLVGGTAEKRMLQLKKGGALLVLGRANLPAGRHNITLSALAQPAVQQPLSDAQALGVVDAEAGTMLDVQHADLFNIQLKPVAIDNTGAKPNERVNVAHNRFREFARVSPSSCDTPLIVNNVFEHSGPSPLAFAPIGLYGCPLAEIRGNTVRGVYSYGIMGSAMIDSVIAGNTIEKCSTGIYWYGENGMFKQNTIRNCTTGVVVTSMSGALEDITIDGCQYAYNHAGATTQLSNVRVLNLPKDGKAVQYATGPLTLLNCNIKPEQVEVLKMERPPPRPAFFVQVMDYLVVGVKGEAPLGTKVEVTTANRTTPLPPGAADLNIRNAPSMLLGNKLTPLPRTTEAMVVRSWTIDADGRIIPAPEYAVRLVHGGKVIHTMNVKPDDKWFRARPNDSVATVEVNVK